MSEVQKLSRTVVVQGEADNSLKRNDTIFFSTRIPLHLDEIVTLQNTSGTIITRVKVTDKSKPFYGGRCIYPYDVADRLNLTQLG